MIACPAHSGFRSFVSIVLVLFSASAHADAGVPMLMLTWPGMVIAFVPVVLVETLILARALRLPFVRALKVSLRTNLISTIAGVPLAWVVMLSLEMATGIVFMGFDWLGGMHARFDGILAVTLGSAWLGPSGSDLYWMVPVATLSLLVPTFFVSCWLEEIVARGALPEIAKSDVRCAILKANVVSYLLLGAMVVALLIRAIVEH